MGLTTSEEAEQAVRDVRMVPSETYDVLLCKAMATHGPQLRRGEVRFLPDAV